MLLLIDTTVVNVLPIPTASYIRVWLSFNPLLKHAKLTLEGALSQAPHTAFHPVRRPWFRLSKFYKYCFYLQIFTPEFELAPSIHVSHTSAGCSVAVSRGYESRRGPLFEQHHSTTCRNNRKEEHTTLHPSVARAPQPCTPLVWTHAEPKGAQSLACTLGRGTSIGALGGTHVRTHLLHRGWSARQEEIVQNFAADIAHDSSTSQFGSHYACHKQLPAEARAVRDIAN